MVSMAKTGGVQIDLMVPMDLYPEIVSLIRSLDLKYTKEFDVKLGKNPDTVWKKLVDIQGKPLNLINLIPGSMMADSAIGPDDQDRHNTYILFHERKGKKNVRKDRKKAGKGSNGGNSGEQASSAV